MRFKATPVSATICGFAIVFISSTSGVVLNHAYPDRDVGSLYAFLYVVFFFLLPVAIFVVGPDVFRSNLWNPFTREYWDFIRPIVYRLLCCFLGAATLGTAYAYILNEFIV